MALLAQRVEGSQRGAAAGVERVTPARIGLVGDAYPHAAVGEPLVIPHDLECALLRGELLGVGAGAALQEVGAGKGEQEPLGPRLNLRL